MSSPNRPYYFIEATPDDGNDILKILEEADFEGNLSIIYTRRPNPVLSFRQEGNQVMIMLCKLKENDELIGFGCCTVRNHYISGKSCEVGYLSGLRIKKEFRKMHFLLTDAYNELIEWVKSKDLDWLYTTVIDDNPKVQKMFEKKRRKFPTYIPIGNFTVHCSTVKLSKSSNKNYLFRIATKEDIPSLLLFLEEEGNKKDLFPEISETDLLGQTMLKLHYSNYNIAVSKTTNRIEAAIYVWHQHEQKQHILNKYNGIYKILKYVSPLLPYFGFPKLPKEGTVLNYYTLSFYSYNSLDAMEYLIRNIANRNKDYNYFLIGIMSDKPLNKLLHNLSKITYCSKAYMLDYKKTDESELEIMKVKEAYVECGLL